LKSRGSRQLVTVTPDVTAAKAVELLNTAGISQLPVLEQGRSVGSVQEVTLARVLHDKRDPNHVTVGEIMARPLPQLEVSVHLDEAYRLLLAGNTGVLAVQDGKVVDIVTRIDLIQYWLATQKSRTTPREQTDRAPSGEPKP
jgi:cystathionine beta-synthase